MNNFENTKSFELRNLIGMIVKGKDIDPLSNQLTIIGNSYKYEINSNKEINFNKDYKIIDANGNILQIEAIIS